MLTYLVLAVLISPVEGQPKPKVAELTTRDVATTVVDANRVDPVRARKEMSEEAQTVAKLVKAIDALAFKGLSLSSTRKLAIARAAYQVGKEVGIDPFFLIALSRMESDFLATPQYAAQCYMRDRMSCMADCGITQHNISGSRAWVFKECKRLTRDYAYAMKKSAEEIKRHLEYCKTKQHQKWHRPYMRCVLNRYNQGTFYLTMNKCRTAARQPWMTDADFNKVRKRCLGRAAYWKKLLCFYYGAKTLTRMKRSCRYCFQLKHVPWYYGLERQNIAYAIPSSL